MDSVPRHLVPPDAPRAGTLRTGVLVIGGGVAGLRSGIEAAGTTDVIVIAKGHRTGGATAAAQGGIAAAIGIDDSPAAHAADTLATGRGLCDPGSVRILVEEGPARLRELLDWGADFDRTDGELALTLEGGHRARRVVHAGGDMTGRELFRVLRDRALARERLRLLEGTFLVDILTAGGRCVGALLATEDGKLLQIRARAVILCTGGAGHLFRETTVPEGITGDGIAAAYRAGAALQDMEFMQFHPTALYVAGAARLLVSEAVRGEGGILRNREGDAFMARYHPDRDLAPRDAVSLAIHREMARTAAPHVWLDVTHLPADRLRDRFPHITRTCARYGIDVTRDWIPVRPTAHYTIGGIRTGPTGRSTLEGLWAAGEAACNGIHGANRLGSNSLLDGLVFGTRAGREAAEAAASSPDEPPTFDAEVAPDREEEEAIDLGDVRNALQSLMTRRASVERDADGLREAVRQIDFWSRYVLGTRFDRPAGWEVQNLLSLGGLLVNTALRREESRGVHFRSDFPQPNDTRWRIRQVSTRGKPVEDDPVPAPPEVV